MSSTTITTDEGGRPTEITVPSSRREYVTSPIVYMESFTACILAVAASYGLSAEQMAALIVEAGQS